MGATAWLRAAAAALVSCVALVAQDAASLSARAIALLQEHCHECHGPRKQKGRLRLDTVAGIASVVKAGRPEDSKLFHRLTLDEDDEKVMPPEGPLDEADVAVLKEWIAAGARADEVEAAARAERALLDGVVRGSGALVVEVAGASDGSLRIDFSRREGELAAAALAALGPVASRVHDLSLAGQTVTAATAAALPQLPKLKRLQLQRSRLEPAALPVLLERVPAIEWLNLHSTQLGDAEVEGLAAVASLRTVVLHDTRVSAAFVESLRSRCPDLRVIGTESLPAEPFLRGGPRQVLVADASKQRIALLRETALEHHDVLWEHPVQQLHDLQLLDGGRVLFQETWTKLVEVDLKSRKVVWSYDAATQNRAPGDGPVEVHSFQRLEGGVTLVAESGARRLIEVDQHGRLLHSIPLVVDKPSAHHDTRLVRRTPEGTYLVAHENDGCVREYDRDGKVVWRFDVPLFDRAAVPGHGPEGFGNQVFSALRLPNGNTLVGTGNGHSVLEVDRAGNRVWQLAQDDLPGIRLAWVTTVQVLSNGNLVLGNCHAGKDQPQIVEVTRDKQVAWKFADHQRFGDGVSNSFVVEDRNRQ